MFSNSIQVKLLLLMVLYNFFYNMPISIMHSYNLSPIIILVSVTRLHISSLVIILCGITEDLFNNNDVMISSIFYLALNIVVHYNHSHNFKIQIQSPSRIIYYSIIFYVILFMRDISIVLVSDIDIMLKEISYKILVITVVYIISESIFGYYKMRSQ